MLPYNKVVTYNSGLLRIISFVESDCNNISSAILILHQQFSIHLINIGFLSSPGSIIFHIVVSFSQMLTLPGGMPSSALCVTLCVLLALISSNALIHNLNIRNDDRDLFKIETFGFVAGGVAKLTISEISTDTLQNYNSKHNTNDYVYDASGNNRIRYLKASKNVTEINYNMGFIMRKASSESAAQQDLESIVESGKCIFDMIQNDDYYIDVSKPEIWKTKLRKDHEIITGSEGLYSLIFARCEPKGDYLVNFKLHAEFANPGPNYLSAGDAPLPKIYFAFFVLFTLALGLWIYILVKDNATVHRIHYMMAVLLLLKCFTLLFEAIRYHYIASVGEKMAETWSIVYYIFAFLKGIMLFTVILLIGSGWSLMKPYLNDKEKKIIMVVLTLQVIDNIAMIILEETSPGSQGWLTWRDILHLVDILCCCAILFPIIWSIKHLRLAAEADGKAHTNLIKLQLFRTFYVMVVCYVYFTRIIVYLIAATIPFYMLWLGAFSTELATLLFYVITGYKFRPAVDNPYLAVRQDEENVDKEDGGEYGLEMIQTVSDDEEEMK